MPGKQVRIEPKLLLKLEQARKRYQFGTVSDLIAALLDGQVR
jgi:hypothetical protein